jgi:CBS domain-containing protein
VKKHEPITGDLIAEMLGLSRPTIRADLSLLVMLGVLDAKPKVGYFLGSAYGNTPGRYWKNLKVGDVLSVPVIVNETASVKDAVVTLFTEDTGSLIVCDQKDKLVGIVSRKDLLKVTLGNPEAVNMPISLVMTRMPNIITVTKENTVLEAARLMIRHEVDCLPVVELSDDDPPAYNVVGRITKTTVTKIFAEGFSQF